MINAHPTIFYASMFWKPTAAAAATDSPNDWFSVSTATTSSTYPQTQPTQQE